MKIKNKGVNIIEDVNENEHLFCPYCNKWNLKIALVPRPNYEARDKDEWRYCNNCNRPIPIHHTKSRGKLIGQTEATSNPFDSQGKIAGLDNKKKDNRDIESIEDEDIKRELKNGNTVEIL